jgi:predicted ATP-grasp superfamily ATP-dependent carboligase
MDGGPVLLVSVSARMLAELAVGAGHDVVAVDRFADSDLLELCPAVTPAPAAARSGLAALADAAAGVGAPAVVYGAGFENRPDLVERLAAGRRLLGNDPGTLRRVRDPFALEHALRTAGLAFPRTFAASAPPDPGAGRWLQKPVRGGGGRGVRPWRGAQLRAGVVVQERIDGLACSATAVGDGTAARVVGLSEQLIGDAAFGARAWHWCGNLAPPRLAAGERLALLAEAEAIAARLAAAFGLRGLFGVDIVWDGERAWVVEVNPRPCGSLEALEAAHGLGAFDAHLASFEGALPRVDVEGAWARGRAAGKAVLFATERVAAGDTRDWRDAGIRDVPRPGTRFAPGQPICTLIAVEPTPQAALEALTRRAGDLRGLLRPQEARQRA